MIFHQAKLAKRFKVFENGQVDEFSDRLSYKFSCLIFFGLGWTILLKQYLTESISCYIATSPGGSKLIKNIESYCLVQGIIPLSFNGKFPTTEDEWKRADKNRIVYYQWIPFVLYLQGILCFLPHILWRLLQGTGNNKDFQHIISRANTANEMDGSNRKEEVIRLAKTLEKLLFKAENTKSETNNEIRKKLEKVKTYLIMWQKKGIPLILFYIVVKVLYVANSVGQIFLMQSFLNLDSKNYAFFGTKILHDISVGKDWQVSLVFPRVGYCFAKLRQLGTVNYVAAQCVLPINMLNERIYIFLWFWLLFLSIANVVSLVVWIIRIFVDRNKTDFLKMYLKLSGDYKTKDLDDCKLKKFESYFLRHDGMFLLRMMSSSAGDLITAEVVSQMWKIYSPNFQVQELNVEKLENIVPKCENPYMRNQFRNGSF